MSDPVFHLVLSLVALAVGPLIVKLASRARPAIAALDAFVLVVVGGLVLLHVLPHSLQLGGWGAVAAAVVGLVLPMLAERSLRPGTVGVRGTAILLAMAGMFVHAMIDGAALLGDGHDHGAHDHAGHDHGAHDHGAHDHGAHDHGAHDHGAHDHAGHSHGEGQALVWAVIAHRLPVGIGIWWIVGRTLGVRVAIGILLMTIFGTLTGFFAGGRLINDTSQYWAGGVFQALVGGSLLHVLLHAHVPAPPGSQNEGCSKSAARARHGASLAGALLAVFVVWLIESGHSHGAPGGSGQTPGGVFWALLLESAPILVLAYLVAGLAQIFVPSRWIGWVNRGNPASQAIRGIAVGLPLPVCSCGVVPIYKTLVARGTAAAAAIGFLIATPELEVAAVLMTFQLMGTEIGLARLGAAAVLAFVVGLAVHAVHNKSAPAKADSGTPGVDPDESDAQATDVESISTPGAPLGKQVVEALRVGLVDMVDQTAPWILVGLGVSAMLAPHLSADTLHAIPGGLDVVFAALLGLPIYVCASGSTPLAAVFVAQGLSPGAAIAFLLTGPATNMTTFGVIDGTHGRRAALGFAVASLLGAIALGYGVNSWLGASGWSASIATDASGHLHAHGSVLAYISIAALALLVLYSILRRGLRGFLESLFTSPAAGGGHHGHDHDGHGHDGHEHGACH